MQNEGFGSREIKRQETGAGRGGGGVEKIKEQHKAKVRIKISVKYSTCTSLVATGYSHSMFHLFLCTNLTVQRSLKCKLFEVI